MTTRLILTLATLLTLAACAADTAPAVEPGLTITGEAEMGITGKL